VLQFYDQFKNITFPDGQDLHRMDGGCIHKYRLDQLQYLFPQERTWRHLDSLYESFLRDIPYFTLPFDRILDNALLRDEGLVFVDFEWTIAGPHEFTLARIAVEFNCYDDPEIIFRIDNFDLYNLFLLRFYMYGRELESIYRYMQQHLENKRLRELFDIINAEKHTDKLWISM
jgi:thiamine kinase-like enzyme